MRNNNTQSINRALFVAILVSLWLLYCDGNNSKEEVNKVRVTTTHLASPLPNDQLQKSRRRTATKVDNINSKHIQTNQNNRNLKVRIVGGKTVTNVTEYPFYGFPKGSNNCGATLIHEDIMISAAHCYTYFTSNGIYLGGNTIAGDTGTFHNVELEVQHPDFDDEQSQNDIMLLKLKESSLSHVIPLNYDENLPVVGEKVVVIGYGALIENGTYSFTLQKVVLEVAPDKSCETVYNNYRKESMVCVWASATSPGGLDSCKGDSGGPVISIQSNTQIGLVSFGEGCAQAKYPSVNTRISYHKDFIEAGICNLSKNPPERCFPTEKPTTATTTPPPITPSPAPAANNNNNKNSMNGVIQKSNIESLATLLPLQKNNSPIKAPSPVQNAVVDTVPNPTTMPSKFVMKKSTTPQSMATTRVVPPSSPSSSSSSSHVRTNKPTVPKSPVGGGMIMVVTKPKPVSAPTVVPKLMTIVPATPTRAVVVPTPVGTRSKPATIQPNIDIVEAKLNTNTIQDLTNLLQIPEEFEEEKEVDDESAVVTPISQSGDQPAMPPQTQQQQQQPNKRTNNVRTPSPMNNNNNNNDNNNDNNNKMNSPPIPAPTSTRNSPPQACTPNHNKPPQNQ